MGLINSTTRNPSSKHVATGCVVMAVALVASGLGCASEGDDLETGGAIRQAVTLNGVTRESFDSQGRQGNGSSASGYISGNQRWVVFSSTANVWAPGVDTNGLSDIYRKDRQSGSITLVSAAGGAVGNGESFSPSVGDNGTVVFVTRATNLAAGATGPGTKILARTLAGNISRVDTATSGTANGDSDRPRISGDGNFAIFESVASNLVAGDTNGVADVFVRNLNSTTVTRASVTTGNSQLNGASFLGSISYDGSVVAFSTDATNVGPLDFNNVTDVYARNLQTGVTSPISFSTTGQGGALGNNLSTAAQITGNGATVAFLSAATSWDTTDTNEVFDVYVRNVGGIGAPARVSLSSSGAQANGASSAVVISFNGNAVAFVSSASNLVAGDTNGVDDVFARDRTINQTIRIQGPAQPNGFAGSSSLRFSGNPATPASSFLVFDSFATNLVSGDTNNVSDVFAASLSP
jgi:hypothetical protein